MAGGYNLAELPALDVYLTRERARGGDRDDAISLMRAQTDPLFREGQLLAWGIPATGVLVETLLDRGTDRDVAEAEAAIERLAAAPADEGLVIRDILLLRLRALLARARGDDTAYRDYRDRYRDMAKTLSLTGISRGLRRCHEGGRRGLPASRLRPHTRHRPEVGFAASITQVTVSRMLVSEIPVSNTALSRFMKQSSTGIVTEGQRIGYIRVSTVTQTLDQQREALEKAGVAKTFSDTMSGGRDGRPALAELMAYVREGDIVVVWKLDRLGRNTLHILETVKALTDRGITLVSVTDGIDSSTAAGRMMIGVLGSLAEYERELIEERTALKRAASRANGTRFGRPRKVSQGEHIATAKRMKADDHTGKDIARYLGVSRATLYRYLSDDRAA
jgi:DNA invertase Pin-like site-specific DNA recombinase